MREYKVIGSGAVLGLIVGFPAVGVGQEQSTPANQTTLEEVVVTGTSIRGAAPVGSNLITVGRAEIEASGAQTLAQVLRSFGRRSSTPPRMRLRFPIVGRAASSSSW